MSINGSSIHSHEKQLSVGTLNPKEFFTIKKIINTLQAAQLSPELQTTHALGVIRHGRTTKKDNESHIELPSDHILSKDPPKTSSVTLDPKEYDPETSTLYQAALKIKQLGYHKVRLYHPHDTVRNEETTALIQQYCAQLGLIMELDDRFEHTGGFGARNKIDRVIIQQLIRDGYMQQSEYDAMNLNLQGEKHILGQDKALKDYISHEKVPQLQQSNPDLYDKVITQVEESYTSTINAAAKSLDQLSTHISHHGDTDEYHLVVGYRTTIQALDKKFTEISPGDIDLNYNCEFGEMHLTGLNSAGYTLKKHKELRIPNSTTYESDIKELSQLDPKISLQNTVIENQNIVNGYLVGLRSCLEDHLSNHHTNLLSLYCKLGGVVRDVVIRQCFDIVAKKPQYSNTLDRFLSTYCATLDENEMINVFELLYTNKQHNTTWQKLFHTMSHRSKLQIASNTQYLEIQQLLPLYNQKKAYLNGSNQHLLQVKSIDGREMIDLEEIYVHQHFTSGDQQRDTHTLSDHIIGQGGAHIIHASGGDGKSTSIKAIVKDIIHHSIPPVAATFINTRTPLQSLVTDNNKQLWILDGLDELGHAGNEFVHKVTKILSNNPHITLLIGTRSTNYDRGDQATIYNIQAPNAEQKAQCIQKYLNHTFGSDQGKPRDLLESTITQLGETNINPLMIAMIVQIMEDDDLSLQLEHVITKSDLYLLITKVLKQKSRDRLSKDDKKDYLHNKYRGSEFDQLRIATLGKLYQEHGGYFITHDVFGPSQVSSSKEHYHLNENTGKGEDLSSQITPSQYTEYNQYLDPQQYKLNDTRSTEELDDEKALIRSIYYNGLITPQKHDSAGYFHKSILDYCGYQYLNTTTDQDEVLHNTLIHISHDILGHVEWIIEDGSEDRYGLMESGDITRDEWSDKELEQEHCNKYVTNRINQHAFPEIQALIDSIYFESKGQGNTIMDKIIHMLNKKKLINKDAIIQQFISIINSNQHIKNKSVISKLESLLEENSSKK